MKFFHHVERSRFEGGDEALCGGDEVCPDGTATADAWTLLVAMLEPTDHGKSGVQRWDTDHKTDGRVEVVLDRR